ncbi:SAG-related sequence SRS22D [Toxoplasma gondii ME49]|uniref:SAG-related sequence SRS22D n=3 Tax=Toxoplasma gondii TaxID=5811 RepID=A0A125YPS6_TOXGV|nr:SAG-related sequence SRS22D [Toxoplasma gondii ME49]EPT30836.1 SAG-related sequence SRS22D [Toxoplasma gondii ME49]ESS31264.1 SAG-related sequence SRS22D [Toxoplasma gondii VEG]|eukprot:XP_018637688.1 SAG-related sequence SRS22D [Toxoplasma gondii ME49]
MLKNLLKMKFSLLTLAAIAVPASALQAKSDNPTGQQPDVTIQTCQQGHALSFNITEGGQSVHFKCGKGLQYLNPKLDENNPQMYDGDKPRHIREFLPSATFKEVEAAAAISTTTMTQPAGTEKEYNFTVPVLPSEEYQLHVNCTATGTPASSRADTNDCQVNFHIASSAVRPVVTAGTVAGVVASLLHFS